MNNELQAGDCGFWPQYSLPRRLYDGGLLAFQHGKGAFDGASTAIGRP